MGHPYGRPRSDRQAAVCSAIGDATVPPAGAAHRKRREVLSLAHIAVQGHPQQRGLESRNSVAPGWPKT